jgi:hypothetical protein
MRYFIGFPDSLGSVTSHPAATFAELCRDLAVPVHLGITREDYLSCGKPARDRQKRVKFLVPAQFGTSPSPRNTAHALRCNLVALDIDDARDAVKLIARSLNDVLGDYAFLAYHTASSTPEAPRIRVLVAADAIPLERYGDAAATLGQMLGLTSITRESMVPVQPMFWPTVFKGGSPGSIYVGSNPDGDEIRLPEILENCENPTPARPAPRSEAGVADLDYLRSPMEGVTAEIVSGALDALDPDLPMQAWIEVGCAIKHQLGDNEKAFALWRDWSSKGSKFPGDDEIEYRWGTLKAQPTDRVPVTVRTLFRMAQALGWSNEAVGKAAYMRQLGWLESASRSGEELLDRGAVRIASVGSLIGQLEKKNLVHVLRDRLNEMGHKFTTADIRESVRRVETEASKASGVPAWAKGIVYVTALNQFYRPAVDRKFAPEVLDLMYSTPAIGEEKPVRPRDYLTQQVGIPQVEQLRYDPSKRDSVVFTEGGVPYVNTYRATYPKPNAETAAEAGAIMIEHVANLIKEPEHQATLLDFMTYLVRHPGKKIRWAVLIQGAPGCGKTFLGVCMKVVLGNRNVRKLNASDVIEGTSNGWAYGQQLVVLEEVRIVGTNRHAVMDKLKPCISDDEISLRRLYEDHRTVPNICNYMMFTNYHDSLAVHDDDRRYFVLQSALQQKSDIDRLGPDYFSKIYAMVRDNAPGLRAWFESREISGSFDPEGRAPVTPYLKDLVDASASPLASVVLQTIQDRPHALVRGDLVSLGCLRACMDLEHLAPFSDQALAGVLREMGWVKAGRPMIEGTRHSLWVRGLIGDPARVAAKRCEII